MNWMEQHGTDGRGARRGRPGHAGSCSFPPSGAGTNSGKEGMRPSGSAYRSRAKPRVGRESWSGNLQEPAVCGKGAGVERRRPPGPAGPGPFSYGNEGRGGAAAWLQCPPSSPRDRGVHRLRPPGERSRSRQSPRPLWWEEQVSELRGGRVGAVGRGGDPW